MIRLKAKIFIMICFYMLLIIFNAYDDFSNSWWLCFNITSQSHIWNQLIYKSYLYALHLFLQQDLFNSESVGLSLLVWTKMVVHIWKSVIYGSGPPYDDNNSGKQPERSTLWGQRNIIYGSSCSVFPITPWYKRTRLYFHARREIWSGFPDT